MNIAIDGPAGAGKSTIAKQLARALDFIYVDTGALYRAIAYYFIQKDIDTDNMQHIKKGCEEINIRLTYQNKEQQVLLNEENITNYLRTEEVGNMASVIAAFLPVREKLLQTQRDIASKQDVIMDGRDIGTCVLPNARLKIYLTASSKTRAERRFLELKEKNPNQVSEYDLEKIETDIIERDHRDMNRDIAPLKQASDAILVDSSHMTIDEVVAHIMHLYSHTKEV